MAREYRMPLFTAITIQALLGLLIALGIDEIFATYVFVLSAFWVGVAVLVPGLSQRPVNALWAFLQMTFLPVCVILAILIKSIWS